jgi:hypothetical protein
MDGKPRAIGEHELSKVADRRRLLQDDGANDGFGDGHADRSAVK